MLIRLYQLSMSRAAQSSGEEFVSACEAFVNEAVQQVKKVNSSTDQMMCVVQVDSKQGWLGRPMNATVMQMTYAQFAAGVKGLSEKIMSDIKTAMNKCKAKDRVWLFFRNSIADMYGNTTVSVAIIASHDW
jgi:hypothetical protein